MKIHIPCDSRIEVGGGYTFIDNFKRGATLVDDKVVDSVDDADIIFLASSSIIDTPKTLPKLKASKKKIVLRIDGYPEDWRNSGRGIARLKEAYREADAVVYQSYFSAQFVGLFLMDSVGMKLNTTIYNGVNDYIFTREGHKVDRDASRCIVVNFYRKDPNKRYEEVMYRYRMEWLASKTKDMSLWIVGRIPTMYKEYNSGFFNSEKVRHFGVVSDKRDLADILRAADEFWFPSFADPCPNALLEALHCGLRVSYVNDFGGAKELVDVFNSENKNLLTLKTMMQRYHEFFETVL